MAIRNANLGGTDITFGEAGITSADWNDTFNIVSRLIGLDNGSQTWNTTNTSYTELSTMNIGATTFKYCLVLIQLTSSVLVNTDNNTAASPVVEIQIGETGSEAQVKEITLSSLDTTFTTGMNGTNAHTVWYLHTLTSGEKSNGFNIIVNGKYTVLNSPASRTSTHHYTIAIGLNGEL